jgi:hypothetical protein
MRGFTFIENILAIDSSVLYISICVRKTITRGENGKGISFKGQQKIANNNLDF